MANQRGKSGWWMPDSMRLFRDPQNMPGPTPDGGASSQEGRTDIDRLHAVWEERRRVGAANLPRGCGKTLLRVHELAASVCLRQDDYIVVEITENRDLGYLVGMISDVFKEYGILIMPVRGNLFATRELTARYALHDVKIVFVSASVAALQSRAGQHFAPDPHGIVPMGHWN